MPSIQLLSLLLWLSWWRICLQYGRPGFDPWVGKIPWRRKWQPAPGFLPGESHGQGSLVGTVHGVTKSRTRLSDFTYLLGFSVSSDYKESACNAGDTASIPGWGKISCRREWLPTPVFLPGEFHGQRSLVGYSPWSPWGLKELDMTEWLALSLPW